mmetsp:Transcript_39998/g.115014  ORF Transcript_39998/g.115014 Transcript_39998/m.115014 type:complete len:248 (-) Transcript_39998:1562-2305(-)
MCHHHQGGHPGVGGHLAENVVGLLPDVPPGLHDPEECHAARDPPASSQEQADHVVSVDPLPIAKAWRVHRINRSVPLVPVRVESEGDLLSLPCPAEPGDEVLEAEDLPEQRRLADIGGAARDKEACPRQAQPLRLQEAHCSPGRGLAIARGDGGAAVDVLVSLEVVLGEVRNADVLLQWERRVESRLDLCFTSQQAACHCHQAHQLGEKQHPLRRLRLHKRLHRRRSRLESLDRIVLQKSEEGFWVR